MNVELHMLRTAAPGHHVLSAGGDVSSCDQTPNTSHPFLWQLFRRALEKQSAYVLADVGKRALVARTGTSAGIIGNRETGTRECLALSEGGLKRIFQALLPVAVTPARMQRATTTCVGSVGRIKVLFLILSQAHGRVPLVLTVWKLRDDASRRGAEDVRWARCVPVRDAFQFRHAPSSSPFETPEL